MPKMTCVSGKIYINGVLQATPNVGVYVFSGYKLNDVNNDGYSDSVNFDEIEAYGVGQIIKDIELGTVEYTLTKLSGQDVADYMPEISTPNSDTAGTSSTSPELLAIEQEKLALEKERREEEKVAHKQLHSEEKVTRTDVMGNEEEQVEGYYPAVRAHKVLEAAETQYGVNSIEILRHVVNSESFDEVSESVSVNSLDSVKFDSEVEYEKIAESVKGQLSDFESGVSISPEAWKRSNGTFSE